MTLEITFIIECGNWRTEDIIYFSVVVPMKFTMTLPSVLLGLLYSLLAFLNHLEFFIASFGTELSCV